MTGNRGRKLPLTRSETVAIQWYLYGHHKWRDLCLCTMDVDSFLRPSDILKLKYDDVVDQFGHIRRLLVGPQKKSGRTVEYILTEPTREALEHWIKQSGKSYGDYLFTRLKPRKDKPANSPITDCQYRLLVKQWVSAIGLDSTRYSPKSLRKTRIPEILEKASFDYGVPQYLLGHADVRSTMHYVGLAAEAALKLSAETVYFEPMSFERSDPDQPKLPEIFDETTEKDR